MDNKGCKQVQPVVRKAKKKQVKDELDRIKQAEKKKRRLEKALATSAAIRSELEKKKQKKKEEQQRLDEDSAAIAEAVALHVLIGEDASDSCEIMVNKEEGFSRWDSSNKFNMLMGGGRAWLDEDSAAVAEAVALHVLIGEDSGDSCEIMVNKEEGFNRWDCSNNFNMLMGGGRAWLPHQVQTNCEGWVTNAYRGECEWPEFRNSDRSFTYGSYGRDLHSPCIEDGVWGNGLSADLIAAQAVSALQITEDTGVDAIFLNRMLRG